jgi:hypothetical protein
MTSPARAQEFPGLGVADMAAANMAFDQQFDQWNRHMSWQLALAIPNDQPLPFNAMTIAQANRETSAAYERMNAGWYANSNRQMDAVGRWTTGAIQGNWYYQPEYGTQHDPHFVLPYGPGAYHETNGYIYEGYNPQADQNLYPVYPR